MENIVSELTDQVVARVNTEKERLVIERLKEIGVEIDFVAESKRTFPRIVRKFSAYDQSESYYWNDGSEQGKLLITFYPMNMPTSFNESLAVHQIKVGLKYK